MFPIVVVFVVVGTVKIIKNKLSQTCSELRIRRKVLKVKSVQRKKSKLFQVQKDEIDFYTKKTFYDHYKDD